MATPDDDNYVIIPLQFAITNSKYP
jgi:hypothetical protein